MPLDEGWFFDAFLCWWVCRASGNETLLEEISTDKVDALSPSAGAESEGLSLFTNEFKEDLSFLTKDESSSIWLFFFHRKIVRVSERRKEEKDN